MTLGVPVTLDVADELLDAELLDVKVQLGLTVVEDVSLCDRVCVCEAVCEVDRDRLCVTDAVLESVALRVPVEVGV